MCGPITAAKTSISRGVGRNRTKSETEVNQKWTRSDLHLYLYQVEDEDAYDEEIDTLKFRLVLRPETEANNILSTSPIPPVSAVSTGVPGSQAGGAEAGMDPTIPLHRLMIQTVGGRSCSQVCFALLLVSFLFIISIESLGSF